MPKIDLTKALQIKGASGELLSLKGSGFSWAKPVASANLLNLSQPVYSSTTDTWIQNSINPLVLNTGTGSLRRGGWSFQSVAGQAYECTATFSDNDLSFSNGGDAIRINADAGFASSTPSRLGRASQPTKPANGIWRATFTGNGGVIWAGIALGYPTSGQNRAFTVLTFRVAAI